MTEEKQTARKIFDLVVLIESPEDQAALLDRLCAEDATLRQRVEKLLAAYRQAHTFLESSPVASTLAKLESHAVEQPGSVIGPYRLMEQIGEGGFGHVFVAEQQEPVKRKVALKLLKPGMDSREVLSRFAAEREALAMMEHPNIARVLDAGKTTAERPYFVMELVHGIPINDYCDENHLTTRERIELFVPVCHAIQHAHQKGIIHRDIKPTNVLVATHDGRPVPKVIDFGVAKALHRSLTDETIYSRFHQMIGTPLYMSPEQADMTSSDIDTRSDIYSLGVLLYELITGTTPFDRKRFTQAAFDEIRRIIRDEDPPKPSTRLSQSGDRLPSIAAQRRTEPARLSRLIQGDLDWIVMKALEKDRTRRYATADNLAKDIVRFLHHEPVDAGPPSRLYRLRKFARRNRGPVIATTFVLLALLLGFIGTTAGLVRTERQRSRAVSAESEAVLQRDKAIGAAEAERQAKEAAQKRLAQIEKGNEILGSIFKDLEPGAEEKEGKPLRALIGERLDEAVQQLEGESVGDPVSVAKLQRTLGLSLLGLGYPENAIVLFTKAREAFTQHCGRDHTDTLRAMNDLATAYRQAAKLDLALPLLEETLNLTQTKLGPDHADTFASRNNLAMGYRDSGNLALALPMFEKTLDLAREKLGRDHAETLATMNSFAMAYRLAGKAELAIPLSKEALEINSEKLGSGHPTTLSIMSNLASAYRSTGKLELALPMLEDILRLRKEKLGVDHPRTLISMNNLALGYQEADKVDQAVSLFEETLKLSKSRLSPDHPTILATTNNLALGYQAAEKPELALPLFEEALKLLIAKFGPNHPNTLTSMSNLATCYRRAGKLELAMPLFQNTATRIEEGNFDHEYAERIVRHLCECLEQLNQFDPSEVWRRKWLAAVNEKDGPDSVKYATALTSLGSTLLQQQKWSEAESVLRASLAIRERQAVQTWTSSNTRSMIGGALLGQQDFANAEPLLLQGYSGLKERESEIPSEAKILLTQAVERLVQLYDAWGQAEKAAEWRVKLDAQK